MDQNEAQRQLANLQRKAERNKDLLVMVGGAALMVFLIRRGVNKRTAKVIAENSVDILKLRLSEGDFEMMKKYGLQFQYPADKEGAFILAYKFLNSKAA